jgi:hypothetical protein
LEDLERVLNGSSGGGGGGGLQRAHVVTPSSVFPFIQMHGAEVGRFLGVLVPAHVSWIDRDNDKE